MTQKYFNGYINSLLICAPLSPMLRFLLRFPRCFGWSARFSNKRLAELTK